MKPVIKKTVQTGRYAVIGLLVVIIGINIYGCGEKPEEEGKKVTVIKFFTDTNPIRKEQIALFEKTHPEIDIKEDYLIPGAHMEKVLTSVAGGAVPDLLQVGVSNALAFGVRGILTDLQPFIEKDKDFDVNDIFQKVVKQYNYKGRQYALPGNCGTFVLFYNKRLFDDAKVEYPNENWTWNDFLDASKKLTKRDENGRLLQYGSSLSFWGPVIEILIKEKGGRIFNEDGTKCIINSPEAREALVFLHELAYKYGVGPKGAELKETSFWQLFQMERAAMFISGRWLIIQFRQNKKLDFRITHLPKWDKRVTILASMGYAIPEQSKNKDVAWKLMKFMVGKEGQEFIITYGDAPPMLKSMFNWEGFLYDPKYPNEDNNKIYLEALDYAELPDISPFVTEDQQWRIIDEELEKYNLDKQTIEEALNNIETRINKVIEEIK
jgi:multiple sugar transport system substrate-binding protein